MVEVLIFLFVIYLIVSFLRECSGWVGEKTAPLGGLAGDLFKVAHDHLYLILGIIFSIAGLFIYVYFRPHPAAKHLVAYRKNDITRQQAIERVALTLYNPRRDGHPSVLNSKSLERRLRALAKRVKAEEGFVNDLISYIRAKEKLDYYERQRR